MILSKWKSALGILWYNWNKAIKRRMPNVVWGINFDGQSYLRKHVSNLNNLKEILESLGSDYEFEIDEDALKVKYLGKEIEFFLDLDELDDLRNEIYIRFKIEEINDSIRANGDEIELEFDKEVWLRDTDESGWGILVKYKDWVTDARILVDLQNLDLKTQISRFLSLKYIKAEGCYCEDYVELVISFEEWYFDYLKYEIIDPNNEKSRINNRITYEISPISDELINLFRIYEKYDEDSFFPEDLMTLKMRNINTNKIITINDKGFLETVHFIAKCILFDISRKYSVNVDLDYANINPMVDPPEGIEDRVKQEVPTSRCILTENYDKDLIEYYYVANQMTNSEFKYLAFYRILECIFDEVYLYETIQDVRQIVTSNWFSPSKDQDIASVIKIVEQYNKNKNDREKLKLVLEKYFRGDNHDEAYFLANKDIISILMNNVKKIKSKEDIKDLQQFANILYDFRCNCAHSNRTFPARQVYEGTDSELENYIRLIRMVSERIIVNYGS